MPGSVRVRDALRAVQIGAQGLDPDPPLDQTQHIRAGIVCFEHRSGEIDEPFDRRLRVAPPAPVDLVALALRCAVSSTERPVEHLQGVVGASRQRLDAERHQHRVAALWGHPRERLVGLLASCLRQPRPPVRRQPGEIEPVSAD